MILGPEIPGRPTVRGVVVVKVRSMGEPGFAWCDGKSVSLPSRTPGEAKRKKPLWGGLNAHQVERREIEYWRTYTPPKVDLVALLKRAMGR